jgi:hypothetical protein
MAGECGHEGEISDNDGKPYPLEYIANHLNVAFELLERTIKKCTTAKRLENKEGVLVILNWAEYQSEYHRQKAYRETADNTSPLKKSPETFEQYQETIKLKYPKLNFEDEMEGFRLYWTEGGRQLRNPKLALRNWFRIAQEKLDAKVAKSSSPGGDGNRMTKGAESVKKRCPTIYPTREQLRRGEPKSSA